MNAFKPWAAYVMILGGFAGGVAMVVGLNGKPQPSQAFAQKIARTVGNVSSENMESLRALNSSTVGLAEFVKPAVVHIRAVSGRATDAEGRRLPMTGSEGSGFIYRNDGYVITNDHVVGGKKEVTVVLNNGKEYKGKVMSAPEWDVAVVKIEAFNLPTLTLADSKAVRPGEMVMAIGSPFGLENSVTFGHVSALGRTNTIQDQFGADGSARFYPDLIQTDAAINVGNSGGPLVNIDGQVIGMNSSIYSRSGGSNGIAFAIPSNQVRLLADLLVKKGKVVRASFGVVPRDLKPYELEEKKLGGGAYIESVEPGSPADKAGIQVGDIVTKIDGKPIQGQMDLRNAMLENAPGTSVSTEYVRAGSSKTTSVNLGEAKPIVQTPRVEEKDVDGLGELFRDGMPKLEDLQKRWRERQNRQPESPKDSEVAPLGEGKATLGVNIANLDEEERKRYNVPASKQGVVVIGVNTDSVADRAGLKVGDVIEKIGDVNVKTFSDLKSALEKFQRGQTTQIKITRYSDSTSSISIEKSIKF